MTSTLPPVPPDVAARAVDLLPGRLRRRLDDALARARTWTVVATEGTVVVTADEQTTIVLTVPVRADDDARCGCLLAPACLHRAALLNLAPPAEPTLSEVSTVDTLAEKAGTDPVVTDAQLAAAEAVWRVGCDLLATGITGAGAVQQAILLRAAHDARRVGLARLGAAALRTVRRLRAARAEEPEFRLAQLVDDVRELLLVAYGLRTAHGDVSLLRGRVRRDYRVTGNLRLYGLLCETITTASGYGGAATYLIDEGGRLWQLGGITPGDTGLAAARPYAHVTIGEAQLTYRALGRGGLRVINALASTDGRLSSGKATTAVAAPGASWYAEPVATLWRPLADQVERYRSALAIPRPLRPCGYDLMFLDGVIAGFTASGLGLDVDGSTISVAAPTDSPDLPYVDNLRALGASIGAPVRLIGRYAGPATVHALAIAAQWLDADGHLDLGVDRLDPASLPRPVPDFAPALTVAEGGDSVPLHLLTRRLERCVEGGRMAAPGRPSDISRLKAVQLHTAAQLAERLDTESTRVARDHFGRIEAAGNEQLALAWLAAAVYIERLYAELGPVPA